MMYTPASVRAPTLACAKPAAAAATTAAPTPASALMQARTYLNPAFFMPGQPGNGAAAAAAAEEEEAPSPRKPSNEPSTTPLKTAGAVSVINNAAFSPEVAGHGGVMQSQVKPVGRRLQDVFEGERGNKAAAAAQGNSVRREFSFGGGCKLPPAEQGRQLSASLETPPLPAQPDDQIECQVSPYSESVRSVDSPASVASLATLAGLRGSMVSTFRLQPHADAEVPQQQQQQTGAALRVSITRHKPCAAAAGNCQQQQASF